MSALTRFWHGRSPAEKWAIGIVGGVVVLATAGAAAYAIATGGAIVVTAEGAVAIGAAAQVLARSSSRS